MSNKTSAPVVDLGEMSAGLSGTCREYLAQHTGQLARDVTSGRSGVETARGYARMYDGLLGSLHCAADAVIHQGKPVPGRVALVAVGGYGRQLVAPGSDVDVVFLCDDPSDPRIVELAEGVLYPLWDAGVDIGHALRGLDESLELSRTDIRTSTTLLDMRQIAGDRSIIQELGERGRREIFENDIESFLESLEQDTVSRHGRFGGSLYLREPELKLGRGGLRDLDVVVWSARAFWGFERIEQMADVGAVTARELEDLLAAQEHMWAVRNRLHLAGRRRQDRLMFEDQEQIARALGYRDGSIRGVEQFMQEHYRHARVIARLVDRMIERVRRARSRPRTSMRTLESGITVCEETIVAETATLRDQPVCALRLYCHVLREGLPPDPETRDAIANLATEADWCARLRDDPEAAKWFRRFLIRVDDAAVRRGSLMEEFHEVGILLAMLPEFEPVIGRVRHDTYHALTVDAQAVAAVDYLRHLSRGERAAEYLAVSRCAAEQPRPLPLYIALLLAGVGAARDEDREGWAAGAAAAAARRLGLAPDDVAHIEWLVTHQGMMYHCATRRDITDPKTIADVAADVQTVYRWRDLYLLTFCQVSTANRDAMTGWNARMLEDLFQAVWDNVQGTGDAPDHLARIRSEALQGVSDPSERAALEAFVLEMPERYLLANSSEGIRFHASVARGRGDGPRVGWTASGVGEDTVELVVATNDRPGLLVDLTAAFARGGFSVDFAQLYTRSRGGRPGQADEAFDLFHISHPAHATAEAMTEDLEGLRSVIEALIEGSISAEELLADRPKAPSWARPGPKVRTEIHVDNAASARYTVVDIYTRDRNELLHAIARTLHERELSIAVAKVNTEGNRVADVFYVQTADGTKLSGSGQLSQLSIALRETISKLD